MFAALNLPCINMTTKNIFPTGLHVNPVAMFYMPNIYWLSSFHKTHPEYSGSYNELQSAKNQQPNEIVPKSWDLTIGYRDQKMLFSPKNIPFLGAIRQFFEKFTVKCSFFLKITSSVFLIQLSGIQDLKTKHRFRIKSGITG